MRQVHYQLNHLPGSKYCSFKELPKEVVPMKATLTRPDESEMGTLSRCGDGLCTEACESGRREPYPDVGMDCAQRLVSPEQVSKGTAGGDVTEGRHLQGPCRPGRILSPMRKAESLACAFPLLDQT